MSTLPDEITTTEAQEILGLGDRSSVIALVASDALKPSRKLPGPTGAYLFPRTDVIALAERRVVEARERSESLEAKLAAAKAAMSGASAS